MMEDDLRATMLDVVGSVVRAMEDRLGQRLVDFEKRMDQKLLELEADVALVHDRLDAIEVDVRHGEKHWSRVSRQQMVDRVKLERLEKKVSSLTVEKKP